MTDNVLFEPCRYCQTPTRQGCIDCQVPVCINCTDTHDTKSHLEWKQARRLKTVTTAIRQAKKRKKQDA